MTYIYAVVLLFIPVSQTFCLLSLSLTLSLSLSLSLSHVKWNSSWKHPEQHFSLSPSVVSSLVLFLMSSLTKPWLVNLTIWINIILLKRVAADAYTLYITMHIWNVCEKLTQYITFPDQRHRKLWTPCFNLAKQFMANN